MDKKNVLVIGSGGREHALYIAIEKSPSCGELYIAPGNGGIHPDRRLDVDTADFDAVVKCCSEYKIDLVVVGPEQPLVDGIVDHLQDKGIAVFGPDKYCAQIEGSKNFAKEMMAKAGVPTAAYGYFEDKESAEAFIKEKGAPIVVKADGLAAGKGVTVAETEEQALAAVAEIFDDKIFGADNATVVIEEFLTGEEASLFAVCDGNVALPLLPAQDHKQVGEGDKGPNTGGMGADAPAPLMDAGDVAYVQTAVFDPMMKAFREAGHPYRGLLYAGLMVDKTKGNDGIKIVEFNCRFGDPETQIILPAIESDVLELLWQSAQGEITINTINYSNSHFLTVVLAAPGYPKTYPKGIQISIPDEYNTDTSYVVHAGTKNGEGSGEYLSSGGRVLNIVAGGPDLAAAQKAAYDLVDKIGNEELFCRRDIGFKALR